MRKYVPRILEYILVVLFILAVLGSFSACSSTDSRNTKRSKGAIVGAAEESGTVIYSKFNGSFGTLSADDAIQVIATPDQKKLVYADKYGNISVIDTKKPETRYIINTDADDQSIILFVYDDGVAFISSREKTSSINYCFHSFLSHETIEAKAISQEEFDPNRPVSNMLFSSGDDMHVIYVENNEICMYSPQNGIQKITECSDNIVFRAISRDGKVAIWSQIDDQKEVIFSYEDGKYDRICEYAAGARSTSVAFNLNAQYYIITNFESNIVYLKKLGESPVKYELGEKVQITDYFTKSGLFVEDASQVIEGVYVVTGGVAAGNTTNNNRYLYYLRDNGDVSLVSSQKTGYVIENGKLYFLDSFKDSSQQDKAVLYSASLNGDSITNITKIDSAKDFSVVGEYVYYVKDQFYLSEHSSLYVKKGNKDAIKIVDASKVYQCYLSDDGSIIYFFGDENSENVNGSIVRFGTLYSYTYGDDMPKLIDSNVIINSLASDKTSQEYALSSMNYRFKERYITMINPNSFCYRVYKSAVSDKCFYSFKYYDGKKVVVGSERAVYYFFS